VRGELYQYPGTRRVSTLAASAHFLTRPVIRSGLGSHQTPVAIFDLVMDLKSGLALIGPILMVKRGDSKLGKIGGWGVDGNLLV